MLARTLVFAGGPGEATAFARAAAADAAGRSWTTPGRGCSRSSGSAATCTACPRTSGWPRPPEVARRGRRRADARRDAGLGGADQQRRPASAASSWPGSPSPTASCSGSTPGLLWVVAAFVQEMGEVDMRRLLGPHAGRRVRPRVAVLGAVGAPVARLHALAPRPAARGAAVGAARRTSRASCGAHRPSACPTARRSSSASCSSRASSTQAARYVDAVAAPAADRRRRAAVRREPTPGCWPPRAATRRRWPRCDGRDQMQTTVVNPVWRPWRTYRAPVLAALGRVDEARDADGRGGDAGPALGRAARARADAAVRRRARRPGLGGDAARGVRAAPAHAWRATSWPAPSWRWPG